MEVSLRLEETSGIIQWLLGFEMHHGNGCAATEMSG